VKVANDEAEILNVIAAVGELAERSTWAVDASTSSGRSPHSGTRANEHGRPLHGI
jgi:hypothetical protein